MEHFFEHFFECVCAMVFDVIDSFFTARPVMASGVFPPPVGKATRSPPPACVLSALSPSTGDVYFPHNMAKYVVRAAPFPAKKVGNAACRRLATESSFGQWCTSFVDAFFERPCAPCRAARAARAALSAVRGRVVVVFLFR